MHSPRPHFRDAPGLGLEAPLDAPLSAARRTKEEPSPKPTQGACSECSRTRTPFRRRPSGDIAIW